MKQFKITWKAKKYQDVVEQNVGRAINQSANYVVKLTKQALSVEGQNATKAAGLNKGKADVRFAKNKPKISNLGAWNSGGTFDTDEGERLTGIYWNATERKWVQASKAGTPPHKQSGDLRRSINKEISSDKQSARVGPLNELVYGRIQELGGKAGRSYLPPRPYLKPSFNKALPTVQKLIQYAIAKASTAL